MHFLKNLVHLMEDDNIQNGVDCYNRNAFSKAIDYLEKAVKKFEKQEQAFKTAKFYLTESFIALAREKADEEAYSESIYNYKRALKLNPGFADIHNNLGKLYYIINEYGEAISCFTEALKINKNFHNARLNLAFVLIDNGDYDIALSELEKLLPNGNLNAKEYYIGGIELLKAKNIELAKEQFNLAFRKKQEQVQILYHNAKRLYRQGRLEEAKKELEHALKEKPNYADIHNLLGIVNLNLGMVDSAMSSIKEAIEINDNYVTAHFNMGFILLEQEMYKEAAVEFQKILRIDADNKIAASILEEIRKEALQIDK